MRRALYVTLLTSVLVASAALAGSAEASSTIAGNAQVVTATVKNAFVVQPSSPLATKVSCPSKQVKAFVHYTCTATVDGQKVPVAISVLDTVPLTVNADPQKSVLSVNRSEGALEGRYFEHTGVAVSAECPGGTKQFLVVDPGTTITCNLVGPRGPVGTATITATDTHGGYASSTLPF